MIRASAFALFDEHPKTVTVREPLAKAALPMRVVARWLRRQPPELRRSSFHQRLRSGSKPPRLGRGCSSEAASSAEAVAQQPSQQQLYRHVLACAVPMVGFGFMDNLVMIQAGEFIDSTLGVTFGLSTLTAAAYGQVVSDVSGTLFGSTIDALAARLGLPSARLTHAQLQLRRVRLWGLAGAVTGVSLGCLLGMTSLLMIDLNRSERLKRQRELRTLFHTLMEEGHAMIGAEHCTLVLVDADSEHLFSLGMRGKSPTQAELRRAFHAYDAKASGSVDAAELSAALRQLGWQTSPAQVEQMIASVDQEGDGQLSFAQFTALMHSAILCDEVRLKVRSGGTRHRVLLTGQVLNISDVSQSPLCSQDVYKLRG